MCVQIILDFELFSDKLSSLKDAQRWNNDQKDPFFVTYDDEAGESLTPLAYAFKLEKPDRADLIIKVMEGTKGYSYSAE